MKNPYLAFLSSLLLPGAGQLILGERAKGWTLLCMAAGVGVSLIASHTLLSWFLMGGIYVSIAFPAAMDAFQTASGRPRSFTGESVPYVIAMLFILGPFAIPLLWRSLKFSKLAKILWTVAVAVIAVLAIVVLNLMASSVKLFLS